MMPCPETAVFQSFGLTLNPLKARLGQVCLGVFWWTVVSPGWLSKCVSSFTVLNLLVEMS